MRKQKDVEAEILQIVSKAGSYILDDDNATERLHKAQKTSAMIEQQMAGPAKTMKQNADFREKSIAVAQRAAFLYFRVRFLGRRSNVPVLAEVVGETVQERAPEQRTSEGTGGAHRVRSQVRRQGLLPGGLLLIVLAAQAESFRGEITESIEFAVG
jgi:hypothetical protein